MAQIRFNVGVPRAGSAARTAESSREQFRSLRPEAGSAARAAEEARREAERDGTARPARMGTIRMRGISEEQTTRVASAFHEADPVAGLTAARSAAESPFPAPEAMPAGTEDRAGASALPTASTPSISGSAAQLSAVTGTGTLSSDRVAASRGPVESTPLQTAAAKFRTLFRSVFSERSET